MANHAWQIEKLHHHFTTGGQVAAPVVKEIVNKIAPILNIHPIVTDLPKIEQALKLDLLSNEVRSVSYTHLRAHET